MRSDGSPLPTYGGQAVIEGVMMRGTNAYSIAVRTPDQSILIQTRALGSLPRSRWMRIPFLRGLLVLWDALVLGIRALIFSANAQAANEAERIEGTSLTLSLVGSLSAGVFAFLLLPAGAAHLLQILVGWGGLATNLFEGALRLALLIGYIWGIGRVPEIRRVFGYHGAEHMTIHAFEAGERLSVDAIARHPKEHPRCGTAFLLTVAVLSILLFSLLGPMTLISRIGTRLLAIPVLASLAYEYIRLTARLAQRPLGRILLWPNLALQKLTTRPPSTEMVEVAIASFEAMRTRDRELGAQPV